jgi:hypothetical protein
MKFSLLRKGSDAVLTKFHVLDSAGDIVGSIAVRNEEANDLERHWLGGATQHPASAPTRQGSALAAALEAKRQPGARPPALKEENPSVAAMLRASKKNTLSAAAILRGC